MIPIDPLRDTQLLQKSYAYFRGCDFTTEPPEIDDSRSPDSLNMLADDAGFPIKRVGWRVMSAFDGKINGLHYAHFAGTDPVILVHHGTKLTAYKISDGTTTAVMGSGMANAKSSSFMHKGKLYILDGTNFQRFWYASGFQHEDAASASVAKVPTTGRGGHYEYDEDTQTYTWVACTPYEEPNLLTSSQINLFAGDGVNTDFWLTEHGATVTKVEVYTSGAWAEVSAYTAAEDPDKAKTKVTFDSAPAAHQDGAGIDNIRVTFTSSEHPADASAIKKCSICTPYGYFNDNRIFISGNPDHKNRDYACGVDDPTYWEINQWTDIGSDHTAIMGYLHYGDILAIVKEDDNQDAEIYIRSATVQSDNSVLFPVQQGVKGVGAISRGCFASLRDDALFYAREGVFAVAGTDASQMRTVQNRSFFVDNRMREEQHKENAVAVAWNNRYLICFPDSGHCYVADARMQSAFNESYVYEWFYWDNIPAVTFLEFDGNLFFGTGNGQLCRMNDDMLSMVKYSDELVRHYAPQQRYTGNPISFSGTPKDVVNKCIARIIPTQDLHGYDHPWGPGGGVNLFDVDSAEYFNGIGPNNYKVYGHTFTAAGTYALKTYDTGAGTSSYVQRMIHRADNTWTSATTISNNGSSETLQAGDTMYVFWGGYTPSDTDAYKATAIAGFNAWKPQVALSSTQPSQWYPYSNVCPISGSTGLSVYVGSTTDQSTATEYAEDWSDTAGTVSEGVVDLKEGTIKAKPSYASYNGETLVGPWMSSLDAYTPGGTPTTGAQVVDLGGAETEYQLTVHNIQLIQGTNCVFTDADEIELIITPDNSTSEHDAWIGGKRIKAKWTTKADTFGTIARVKTLTKRGCTVMLKPYARSSVKISVITHNVKDLALNEVEMNVWDFADLDFSRIDFNAMATPQVVPIGKKVKKFQQLQLVLENDGVEECFGIYGIQVQYTVNNYIK
jgi:hypothetical protein